MTPENDNFLKHAFKDKIMIWIFRIAGIIILIALLVIVSKMILGNYINLWGLQINAVNKKSDTVFYQMPPKTDTFYLPQHSDKEQNSQEPSKKEKAITQQNKNGDNQQNTFNAPVYGSVFGGKNNSVTNFFTPKTRVISDDVLREIISKIPRKDFRIFLCNTSNDGESISFRNDIETKLHSNGYTNISKAQYCSPNQDYYRESALTYGIEPPDTATFMINIPPIIAIPSN